MHPQARLDTPSRVLRFSFAAAAAVTTLLAPAAARGQDSIDPVDPIEDQALAEEAQAKFDQALDSFRQAFDTAVEAAGAGGPARRRNLSRAEVILEKIDSLTETVTAHEETEKFLEGYDDAKVGPVLGGQLRWQRARLRMAAGDVDGGAALATELGIVRDWWVMGPFDNERGRGFNVSAAPEQGIDLDSEVDGKERPVSWRKVPVRHALGYVDLDALLRPSDQASAYAVAFVKSETAQEGALRLGSDEAVKAWWNGAEVISRDVRRPMAFDQDVAGVMLNEGWNVLLLKVHDQTGAWGFRARLTGADGAPLTGVSHATDRATADAAIAAKPQSTKFDGEVDAGAKGFFDEVTGDGAGARDLFHLGYLHHRRGFDSVTDRKAENLLKQATELNPENPVYRFHYAEAAAPPTEMSVEKEENRQRTGREETIELEPGYALAYRALAVYYTRSLQNLERAESLLRKALEINPEYLEAHLDLAGVLQRRGLGAAAQLQREKAISLASAQGREAHARAVARESESQELGTQALAAWQAVLALDARGNGVRRKVAELAAKSMDHDSALAMLAEITRVDPFDTGSIQRRAEMLEGVGDLDGAAAALTEALSIAPEDDRLLRALGRVQLKAGKNDDALATYREALRVNPKLQDVERYVEFLDPAAAPYEDDYEIDVAALIEKAADYSNEENDGWLVLLDQNVNKVNTDGTSSTFTRKTIKILTAAGVKQYDRYFAQGWSNQAFKWKHAKLLKADGTVVDAKTIGQGNFHLVDFPPLEAGDIIDVAYRQDDRSQSFFGDYFGTVNYFADQVPMLLSTYTLITPTERDFFFHTKGVDFEPTITESDDGATRVYEWIARDTEKVRGEQFMPAPRESYPQVQVTTYESWDAFSTWWWSMIRDQHIASDTIKAKVAELVEGKETRYDKIRAIYEFVTGEVTYQAWEFGVHGYKPYTTTSIFEKREGDCKDKAILFNTMLAEIGIEAYPVLIMGEEPRSEEDFTLAMVNHFNHCISYVPDVDGTGRGLYLDGTVQYGHMELPPSMDRGAKVLIVKPDGAEITEVPLGTPDDQGVDQKWNVVVNDDGSATVEGTITFRGDIALQIRRVFSVEGQRPLILQSMLAQTFGGVVTLKDSEFSDLKDLTAASEWVRIEAEVPQFAKGSADTRTLQTNFLQLMGDLTGVVRRPEREHDLMFMNPIAMRLDATYTLPEGWTLEAAPENEEMVIDEARFVSQATSEGNTLTLHRATELRSPRITVEAYQAFRDGLIRASALTKQNWKVRPGSAAAGGDDAPETPDEAAPEESDPAEKPAEDAGEESGE